ncbi:hypothetical protein [Streptomyces sp. NPDC017529]|uniref:hypothetical protein n=1 Tax=Streptomyces sp. NPDC017529 TaxID=3365000 RepID=UPI00379743F0
MTSPSEAGKRPDYPPKTPPPPKKPISPFPPEPNPKTEAAAPITGAPGGRRRVMANRRGANWPLDAYPWTQAAAGRRVMAQLRDWGHQVDEKTVGGVVGLLVETAVEAGGRRVSLHLADQGGQALVLVCAHQPGPRFDSEMVLRRVAGLGAVSCGTDTAVDGRRVWAVLDL